MTVYLANKETQDELLDLHNGLHRAMEKPILFQEYSEAERILRIVDENMSQLINKIKPKRYGC